MKRILLISHYFPPLNQIASLRLGYWAKYLANMGVGVDVITTQKYPEADALDLNILFPKEVNIYEVSPALPKLYKMIKRLDNKVNLNNRTISLSKQLSRKYITSIRTTVLRHIGSMSSPTNMWYLPMIDTAKNLISNNKYNAMITSYSPPLAHLVGKYIKKRKASILWIADFRDPWFDNPIVKTSAIGRQLDKNIEGKCMKYADVITTVSHGMETMYAKRYKDKQVYVMPNGYDPDDFVDWKKRLMNTTSSRKPKKPLIIAYTGTIYPGYRDISPLLVAIRNLMNVGIVNKINLKLVFAGTRSAYVIDQIIKYKLEEIVEYKGHVPRPIALQIQKNASSLLLLGNPERRSDYVLTGKVFEYALSGRPVLAIGFGKQSELAKLLKRWGVGINCEQDIECIEKYLLELIKYGYWQGYKPNITEIAKYDVKNIVTKLYKIISNNDRIYEGNT